MCSLCPRLLASSLFDATMVQEMRDLDAVGMEEMGGGRHQLVRYRNGDIVAVDLSPPTILETTPHDNDIVLLTTPFYIH